MTDPACDKCGGFVLRVEEDELKCLCCSKRTWKAWPSDVEACRDMKGQQQGEAEHESACVE